MQLSERGLLLFLIVVLATLLWFIVDRIAPYKGARSIQTDKNTAGKIPPVFSPPEYVPPRAKQAVGGLVPPPPAIPVVVPEEQPREVRQ